MPRGGAVRTTTVAATAVAAVLAGCLGAQAAVAEPSPPPGGPPTAASVHAQVEVLYDRAERATESYNKATEQVRKQQDAVATLSRSIARTQDQLSDLKDEAGAAARAQYRSGGLPPEARLLLSNDPATFMDDLQLARKGERGQTRMIRKLADTKNRLEGYAADATDTWERLKSQRKKKAATRKRIKKELAAAKKLESRLDAAEQRRLRELEDEKARTAQAAWIDTGILNALTAEASPAGRKALKYATEQLGKPYRWGAEGPGSFDCSGLTMRAWGAAGVSIPRTSQEQFRRLKKIPVERMRPGDLIIYKRDAGHVALYAGDGAIIHAPRPGRPITVAGAGSMPIKAVVRPDAQPGAGA